MDIAVLEEISAILEGISEGASGIQMILSPLTSIGSLITYVLMGLAVMMLGQKLGVKNPWLSWIPYANVYAFGRLADHYLPEDPAKRDKPRRSAKLLLILNIVLTVFAFGLIIVAVAAMALVIAEVPEVWMIVAIIAMLLALLAMAAVSVVYSVFYYIAFYKITRLFLGEDYKLMFVLGLVLSLVGISVALPVIMFVIAYKAQNAPKAE
ncbi:MAG: hypothetical protein IJF27_00035 [Oscillospiraceae bacterium]|nr:hypothetical protein [Oscillospiraceae bacterium]MBQ3050084.1 hypothetical protein [Oscillospiraceae bacterium]MBQ9938201.1 hypothetical protein [Oscillospiraceae bacterium]